MSTASQVLTVIAMLMALIFVIYYLWRGWKW